MKIKERYHPYPVLAPYTEDYINSEFNINAINNEISGKEYIFDVKLHLKNDGLEDLIAEGKAEYIIHVECSKTSFRKVFFSDSANIGINIETSQIDGNVEFAPFIIAKTDIENYTNNSFDSIFEGFGFNIKCGQYLAVSNIAIVTIINDTDALKQLSSIIRIAKVADLDKEIKINLEGDRIQIMLSNDTYGMYTYASRNHSRLRMLHSMIVFPSLIHVLYELKEDSLNNFEQYSDRRWFQALEIKLKELGMTLDTDLFNKNSPYQLAQILLDFPISDALNNIYEHDQEEN